MSMYQEIHSEFHEQKSAKPDVWGCEDPGRMLEAACLEHARDREIQKHKHAAHLLQACGLTSSQGVRHTLAKLFLS